MNGVVRTDQKIGAGLRKLIGGREHQLAHAVPISVIDALHILAKRVRVHLNLRMIVRTAKLRPFHTDCPVTKRRAFR